MIARSHRNAIIFCGTMGLIRRSAFNEIGGWNQECITEDAEASLRMLGAGYRGVYDPAAYGEGLMPLDFDGLKKQRFRWALGGIQILKFHWREMLPFAQHRMRLTIAQRIHYLLGSVQWFAEVLTATFTVLLLATALAASLHERLPVRQLTGAVLVVPLAFASTGMLRAVWALRRACHAQHAGCHQRAARVVRTVMGRHARLRSRSRATARRVPSHREEQGRTLAAERDAVVACRNAAHGRRESPGRSRCWCARQALRRSCSRCCSLFEAFVYSNAPWASLAAEGIILTPERRAYARSPQNTGDRPERSRPDRRCRSQ